MSELQHGKALVSRESQTSSRSNEQKALDLLNKSKVKAQISNMARFDGLVAVYLGVDAKFIIQNC